MSRTCTEFVPKRKFADGHGTDGEQALAGGTKVVQACSAGLSAKIDENATFGDVWHATSGLEEGRAQHGHSSSAHSTPRNQCRDAGVVVGWLFVHQLAERWIKGHWGQCACWDIWICVRAHLRPGMCYVLVLTELQHICRMDTQGDTSLLDA